MLTSADGLVWETGSVGAEVELEHVCATPGGFAVAASNSVLMGDGRGSWQQIPMPGDLVAYKVFWLRDEGGEPQQLARARSSAHGLLTVAPVDPKISRASRNAEVIGGLGGTISTR
jgi:hypothetical protein